MFEKTLSDLVRGIRSHRGSEAQYISQCMAEIKRELKSGTVANKANAISKLTYLQMLGYDISWAAFNIIEVMSTSKFTYKRIAYLAATQIFHDDLDVVMLTTNMIKKDLSSPNQYESGLALNGLACFVTPDIARDLANDVLTMTSSSKPYLKKKAIIVLYKIFLKFPDALRPAFPRLKAALDDPDPGVQCAAVSVICELAQKNPKNYLSLAPTLFKLMNSSSNNWMLIKIIKLFGALCPLEPRLGKKLAEPLTSLIHSTSAMSLLYECINTVVIGMPANTAALQLCVSKLRLFMEDADQNLKYLGLLAMSGIMQQYPKAVIQVKDIIMDCIEDKDESIRVRALELIMGMANKKNMMEIVKKLMSHIDTTESTFFRDVVIEKIIAMCSMKGYQHITNFEWYLTILVEMTRFEGTRHGKLIAAQMLDVTIRVKDVRPFSVRQMATIVENNHLFVTGGKDGICEVLYAASWIVGEFSEHLADPHPILEALLDSRVTNLPGHIQAVFVQNIVKLYASILVKAEAEGTPEATEAVGAMLVEKLPVFMQSGDLEVQERACGILQLMKYIVKLQSKGAAVADELRSLFVGDLNPIAPKAQRKVPVPEGLDLDKWINDPPSESEEEDDMKDSIFTGADRDDAHRSTFQDKSPKTSRKERKKGKKGRSKRTYESEEEEVDEEELEKAREQRRQEIASNPHYLKASPTVSRKKETQPTAASEVVEEGKPAVPTKDVPITKLELGIPLIIEKPTIVEPKKKSKKGKKGKKGRSKKHEDSGEEETHTYSRPQVNVGFDEMPEGAVASDDDKGDDFEADSVYNKLNVDLDAPLRDDEVLPVRTHRVVTQTTEDDAEKPTKKSSKKKGKEKKKSKRGKSKVEEEEGEEEMEVAEEEAPKKSKSKKKSKTKKEASPGVLLDLGDDGEGEEKEEEPMLIEDMAPKKAKAKASKSQPTEKSLDDMEFWLSGNDAAVTTEATTEEPELMEVVEEEPEAPQPSAKTKKTKKGKSDKKSKKSKKRVETVEEDIVTGGGGGHQLLDLDLVSSVPEVPKSLFKPLAEDENLAMEFDTRANPMFSQQVTILVVFRNKINSQLVSLDFNVLDSLGAKLDRPVGVASQSGIPLPFQLPPGTANECQFTMTVQEFHMPHKLRGTVTYMIKTSDGTAQDKLDFKLSLMSSAFICPTPVSQEQFYKILSSGNFGDSITVTVPLTKISTFNDAVSLISTSLHLNIIELVENSVSLYGSSVGGHHVCFLLKSTGDSVQVNAKGNDGRLMSSLVNEIKNIL